MKQRRVFGVVGPLAVYANGFRLELESRGYTSASALWRHRQLRALSRWLLDHHLGVDALDVDCVARMVAERRAMGRATLVSVKNFDLLLGYLRDIGAVPLEISWEADPVSRVIEQYRAYLVTERGAATGTIAVNVPIAERFCRDSASRDIRLEDLTAGDVTFYVASFCGRSSVGWSKKTVTALASFLRFLHVTGVTNTSLVAALPKVAGYRRTLPCELDDDDMARLLAGCDRRSTVGLRDYAILITVWRLGLRACEVVRLTVEDIDWRRGEVTIRGKGNRLEVLPIPADVGKAVATYLCDSRRRVPPGCRAVFVSVRAPEGPMTSGGISDVVNRMAHRVGMGAIGPHLLRHGTATQLLRHGASWPEVAQVLRHNSIGVTASYATVEPSAMTELARPWPGV
jgi:site-specific recombinase XerD